MHVAINAWFWDNPSVGSGQYLHYLLPALLKADPTLNITLVSCKPITLPKDSSSRLKSFTAPTILSNQASNLAKIWFEQITFPRVCRYLKPDVAHVPYFGSAMYPTDPTVVTIHDIIPVVLKEYRGSLKVRLYTAMVSAAARQANLVMADSDASRHDILKRLRLDEHRVRTVYLAPAPQFQPVTNSVELKTIRQKYNLPPQFMLYLGGFDVRKNIVGLLKAYADISATLQQQYPLVIAGGLPKATSDFFPDPVKLSQTLDIDAQVCFPGWIEEADKTALYAAATAFVYPSRYEGFGLPVLEAMACGTPVITTNVTSLPELAGQAASLIAPDDTTGLTQALTNLCEQTRLRNDLTQQGFSQVARFTWPKTAAQTLQAYRDVLPDG